MFRREKNAVGGVKKPMRALFKARVLNQIVSCGHGRIELGDSNGINEGPASRILLNSRIVEHYLGKIGSGSKTPSVSIASVAAAESLEGKISGLRVDRNSEHLILSTGPGGPKGESIESAIVDGDGLGDGGVVTEADGVDAMGNGEEHSAGLGAAGDVLDEAIDLPFGERVFAEDDSVIEVDRSRGIFKVAIGKETIGCCVGILM